MENEFIRQDGRAYDEMRPVSFQADFAPYATGSVLVSFGNTKVICAACLERKVPGWMNTLAKPQGWMTAEYSMLPYSTITRKPRPSMGKQDGRSIEIQRLIGRSIRAIADLSKIPGFTIAIDCDVLQADGGTRTASISGAYVAAKLAVKKLMASGELENDPFTDSVAAVSVGICDGQVLLDLPYVEDVCASVDANIVMTGSGRFVELQSTGEEATFDASELAKLIDYAKIGIEKISKLQIETIEG